MQFLNRLLYTGLLMAAFQSTVVANDHLPHYRLTSNGLPGCFIYGYTEQLLVAEVSDAAINEVAYTSFEDNTTGYWLFNSSGIQSNIGERAITGNKYYSLVSGNITKSFIPTIGKNVVVSYWSRSGAQQVNSAGPTVTGRSVVINGHTWTLYEHLITNPVTVTISGTGLIDEVRLFPEDAAMNTFTYEPSVGVTTECDMNNRIVYYEYDIFKRLSVVRDQDYKIVKKYCYGNAGEQQDCTGQLYVSIQKGGTYTRAGCGIGYQGSSVTYTVAAGTYVSAVNQQTADQMAQDDVNANGQVYANINGSCNFVYYNTNLSGNYYSQNCQQGETPEAIYVSVPANMFSSIISQQDANNQALQYAQNYANQYGLCTSDITLYFDNQSFSTPIYVFLTNTSTWEQSFFEINYSGTGELGNIPAGNYDIEIYDNYGWYYMTYTVGCYYTQSGYSATFYDIPINSTCNTISIY